MLERQKSTANNNKVSTQLYHFVLLIFVNPLTCIRGRVMVVTEFVCVST